MERKIPAVTVDTVIPIDGRIVLIKRKNDPFRGKWALPGGFVDYNERVEDAAVRETREETGLDVKLAALLGVYSAPGRDPRGHVVSVVYIAKTIGGKLRAADDAADAALFSPSELPDAAFDHDEILKEAIKAMTILNLL